MAMFTPCPAPSLRRRVMLALAAVKRATQVVEVVFVPPVLALVLVLVLVLVLARQSR